MYVMYVHHTYYYILVKYVYLILCMSSSCLPSCLLCDPPLSPVSGAGSVSPAVGDSVKPDYSFLFILVKRETL